MPALPPTARVQTDERSRRKYFRPRKRAIRRHRGGKEKAEGAYEAAYVLDARPPGKLATGWGARVRGFRVRVDGKTFGFFGGVCLSGNPATQATINLNETAHRHTLPAPFRQQVGHQGWRFSEQLVGAIRLLLAPCPSSIELFCLVPLPDAGRLRRFLTV